MATASQLEDVKHMSYKQTPSLRDVNKWKKAMQKEMESTWTNEV